MAAVRAFQFIKQGDHVMKLLRVLIVALLPFLCHLALAADKPDDAIAMVDKGLAYLKKNGKEALIKEINNKNPEFISGDVYLVMRSMEGVVLAHPINPKLIGKNMVELPDANGKLYRKDILEIAKTKGKGWVDYRFMNPLTKEMEDKTTYLTRSGDVILEAGIYKGK
jgi:cytochrome c